MQELRTTEVESVASEFFFEHKEAFLTMPDKEFEEWLDKMLNVEVNDYENAFYCCIAMRYFDEKLDEGIDRMAELRVGKFYEENKKKIQTMSVKSIQDWLKNNQNGDTEIWLTDKKETFQTITEKKAFLYGIAFYYFRFYVN